MRFIITGAILTMVLGTTPFLNVADWRKARDNGWVFSERHDGKISTRGEVLRIVDDEDGLVGYAEVSYPQVVSTNARFAVVLKARFLKIGQDDDSTGQKSNWRLLLGAKSPNGNFGIGFNFTADRYKVDANYKIYRTDANWHTWRFEVDTAKKTVALFRDDEYVCLHKAGSPQEAGVRIQVQGCKEVPAEIEIAELQVLPIKEEMGKLGNQEIGKSGNRGNSISQFPNFPVSPFPNSPISPGEWLMLRRDARNTGVSPLKGNLKRPRIAWSHPVKGLTPLPHFIDVDGDGKKEALSGHGGNFSAYRLDGSLLWRQRMENTSVYAAGDLDEDGERELLVASGVPSQVKVLRARDGKVLYTCELFPKAGVGGIRVAKLDPQKKGLQAVVWSTQHEIGFCLSFADGVKNAKVDWTFDWKVTNFSPEVALADMDRDGVLDVVVVTYGHVFVFDGCSGRTKVDMEWHAGRNYGTLVVKDINADGYPDIVILSDQLREHVAAIQNEAGKSLRLLWDTFYEQNYPEDKKSLRVLSESVDDFDGDGRTEIVYAVCDETTDGKWHTLVVDALTGSVKRNLLGYLVGAGALFPNQPPVLFLSQPSSRTELSLNRVSVWSGQNGPWREQATLPTGTLLPLRSARDFEPFAWSLSQVPTTVIRNFGSQRGVFLSGEKNVEFLTGDVAGKIATRWRWEQSSEGNVVGVEEVVPDAGKPQVLLASKDDVLRIVGSNGKTFGEVKPVGFVTSPVVARLRKENAPSILFFDAKGSLCCVRVSDGKSQLLWSQPASGSHGAPVVVDLDGDGEKEILVAQTPNKLVALDALGSVKRSWQFPSLPFQWTFGNFDGDDALDLFVTYKLGLFVDVESVAVSGKTGKVLWRAHCGNNGPPAVCDADGDGIDDVILRDLFERRVLNGRTGRDIYPIIQWAGYHAPILVPMNGAKKPPAIVWVGGSYSMLADTMEGEQLWWKPFRATGHQAVADVDGDGRLEVGGVTAGQLYNWPQFYAVDGPNKEFMCYDALTGEVKWSFPLGVTASGVVAADLDGDGKMEFLLGTADGRLMALRGGKAAERKLWELTFPAALGTPIVCAANGDGKMEILVSCADGNLYCVSSESF